MAGAHSILRTGCGLSLNSCSGGKEQQKSRHKIKRQIKMKGDENEEAWCW